MTATPDRLPRDGSSQSVITLTARDAQNRPVSGLRLTLAVRPVAAELSAREVVTDASGQADFTVTAPLASALVGDVVTIEAIPVGSGGASAVSRVVTISLTGAPNRTTPSPSFTFTPTSPEVGQVITFNASASTDEGVPCPDACVYSWTLGTEATRTGRIVTYAFRTPGIQSVTLTMMDASGTSASAQQNVTVTAAARPTAAFTVTPAAPFAGQTTSFTATTTVAGHQITQFDWAWGDGTTTRLSNASTTHTFTNAGVYVVTLTVTDDLGQTASFSNSVTVASGTTASFTFSPTEPQPNTAVQFNGSASTTIGGSTITEWKWEFGDGAEATESDASTTHTFTAENTYKVRLTVTDSGGRTGTTTVDVPVAAP